MQIQHIPLGKLFGQRKLTPRLASLAKVSLFSQLTPGELDIVDGLLHRREYVIDEVVFDEGEEGRALYLVLDGEVTLSRRHGEVIEHVATLAAGSFFGDMALLDALPRTAQARASQVALLAVFFRTDFMTLMETHARIASKISLQLAREMGRRIRQQQTGTAEAWRQQS
jgi:CRP-like cAMP-binding protein